ncbi:MTG1 GTPase, partial [Eolophus roseicapillus]|nr:MTG1 GTPase [Eolophus roseicapilla]
RECFDFSGRDVATWFPGHMAKGEGCTCVPCQCTVTVLNVAHIPLSGRNPILKEVLGIRPHILVLNKMDLADPSRQPVSAGAGLGGGPWVHAVRYQQCLFLSPSDSWVVLLLWLPVAPGVGGQELVAPCPQPHHFQSTEYSILVIGVPNVGKSSLINSLRRLHLKKGKATAVGGEPGVTKAVLTRIQVCEKPLMYLVDTPGVLAPKLGNVETGMKLALCGAIRDHLVGEDIMADYLLYALNKRQQFRYVQHYGLAEACDDIGLVLRHVALAQGRVQKVKVLTGTGDVNMMMLNYPAAAYKFLRDFRAGRLGRVTLD